MSKSVSLENVLKHCGDFSRFQFLHYIFLNLITIGSGITTYYYVFGVAEPSFRCRLPSWLWESEDYFQKINQTHQNILDAWQPKSKCSNYNQSFCHEFVYDRSVFGYTFTEESNFVCDYAVKRTWLSTLYQVGGFAVLITGAISDKIGRQKMIRILTVLLVLVLLLTEILLQLVTMSVDAKFALLLVNQLFSGIDAYSVSFLLLMELTSSLHTSLAGNLALIGFTFGEALVTMFAYLARDWLILKWIITGYYALVLPYLYFVPESPYWLFSTKKYKQLENCLTKIATMNGRTHTDWYSHYTELLSDPDIARRQAKYAARTTRDKIFKHVPKLLICGIIGFVTMLLYIKISYGLSAMNDAVSPYWNNIIGAVVEAVGYLSASILITTRLGRKYSLMIYALLTSICVVTIPFVTKPLPIVAVVISQIGKLTISGAVSTSWVYVPEIFPTSMRGLANGVFVFVGRFGAILAPIIDAALSDETVKITFYIYASLTIVLVGIIYFLPETRNQSFHTSADEEISENETEQNNGQVSNDGERKVAKTKHCISIPLTIRSNRIAAK